MGSAYLELGRDIARRGRYDEGEQLLQKSLRIREAAFGKYHPDCATTLHILALIIRQSGDLPRSKELYLGAVERFRRSLGDKHPRLGQCMAGLGACHFDSGDYVRAASAYAEVNTIFHTAAYSLVPTLSEAQALRWVRSGGLYLDEWMSARRRISTAGEASPYEQVWAQKSLASRLMGNRTLAGDSESAEHQRLRNELRDARLRLAGLISQVPALDEAARYQRQLTAANNAKERLEKQLAERSPITRRFLAMRDAVVEDLLKRLPPGVAVVDFVQTTDYRHMNSGREADADPVYDAFVLKSPQDESTSGPVWVELGPAEPIDASIRDWRATIQEPATGHLSQGTRDKTVPQQILRRKVWDRLEAHLSDCHTVVVIPDGELNRVPWAALPGRNRGSFLLEDYSVLTASFGQQLYDLLSTPSPQGDRLLAIGGVDYDQRKSPSSVTGAMGSMNEDRPVGGLRRSPEGLEGTVSWPFLPGTLQECAAIEVAWAGHGDLTLVSGSSATEARIAVELSKCRYAHVATHGFFAAPSVKNILDVDVREQQLFGIDSALGNESTTLGGRNPLLLSGLVTAGANLPGTRDATGITIGDDGILTAEELAGLNLEETELVTLSACETALGDVAGGEGVFGLQRVLHGAGVRTVVASLWKVEDRATQELMKQFYANLWIKKQSKVDALRNAQLYLLNNPVLADGTDLRGVPRKTRKPVQDAKPGTPDGRAHPMYWAAWTLSGDWR